MKPGIPGSCARPIRATYRVQFNERFRLSDAREIVPYLHELGISHLYASPLTMAAPHSQHGYDVCDFKRLNPELGTEQDLSDLIEALHKRGMGLILDVVPNHMDASDKNPWWWEVLRLGKSSPYADFFDIEWDSGDPRTRDKILLPVLGDRYALVLARREIALGSLGNGPRLSYADRQFPLTPQFPVGAEDFREINENPAALDGLLQRQHYCLTYWKRADTDLNYRRFFSIASLVGVRVEEMKVFEETHSLVKQWSDRGWLDGLRVDHPDGLRNPREYLERLQALCPHAWIVVEKILQFGEPLPISWPVSGTTGYDFLNWLSGIFVATEHAEALTQFYREFSGITGDYEDLVYGKKMQEIESQFAPDLDRLLRILLGIVDRHWQWRDFTRNELREGIKALAAAFPVYRIYGNRESGGMDDWERGCVENAIECCSRRKPTAVPEVLAMLRAILQGDQAAIYSGDFHARFQQFTGPVMAKGVEDTAFYCYNRFIALNEVGGNPGQFGGATKGFHDFCADQQRNWPNAMLATSTHDTKRSEDVRARLNVLTEIPEEFTAAIRKWSAMNARHRQNGWPDPNLEYHFYQTVIGAWPIDQDRIQSYLKKAAREAKEHTSWNEPNQAYEGALRNFVAGAFGDVNFTADVRRFVSSLVRAGHINSLSQTLIKLTAPGVPDLYQGSELWTYTLVDPDNRQSVDFKLRCRLLNEARKMSAGEAWSHRDDRIAKLWLTWRVLSVRAENPELFAGWQSYLPLSAQGDKSEQVVAFCRGESVITVAQRLPRTRQSGWEQTFLDLPPGRWLNVMDKRNFEGRVPLDRLLNAFPVALLIHTGHAT